MGVVPIVNENDTVSVSEIKFGDNDSLSAIAASMIHADYLFLLTDVEGLYTANPRKDPSAKLIEVVSSVATIRSRVSTTTLGSNLGTGGMETKLIAAEMATDAGVTTIITSSKRPENILTIIEHHNSNKSAEDVPRPRSVPLHTMFTPSPTPVRDLKSWTSHTLNPAGSIIVDTGAHSVLSRRESGGRLLAAGVIGVIGSFAAGQAVRIVILSRTDWPSVKSRPDSSSFPVTPSELHDLVEDLVPASKEQQQYSEADVTEVGRGMAIYNSVQIDKIKGLNSSHIPQMLGYADSEYVVENITIRVPPLGG